MRVLLFLIAVALTACAPDHAASPVSSAPASAWLCRPDLPTDPCRSADLTATELRPDGSRVRVSHRAAEHPAVDCFYVYPTVDLELVPGNHEDLADVRKVKATTIAQAARFTEACALWVPLYRQVTIGTYLQSKLTLEHGLALAFTDIERARGFEVDAVDLSEFAKAEGCVTCLSILIPNAIVASSAER